MNITFYHYVHCPFCVRVRMTLGFLDLPYKSIVVPYNDEKTPISLTGKKMLPILVMNGKTMNESLDIMEFIDQEDRLKLGELREDRYLETFNELLNKLGKNVHNLSMPYWVWTPEFDEASRRYFQEKKELKRGPFKELVKKRNHFCRELLEDLSQVSQDLRPYYRSESFSVYDILLASHLWGLYVVPEFQFPVELHRYLQNISELCHFDYHEDFWS